MDTKYIKLFSQLAHTIEVLSEQVMDLNQKKQDKKGVETAQTMRDDYQKLYDKMRAENFNPESLDKKDYAKLLVGAIIVVQQVENKIAAEQKALQGYKIDVVPKLERLVYEIQDDDERMKLSAELFAVQPELPDEKQENK